MALGLRAGLAAGFLLAAAGGAWWLWSELEDAQAEVTKLSAAVEASSLRATAAEAAASAAEMARASEAELVDNLARVNERAELELDGSRDALRRLPGLDRSLRDAEALLASCGRRAASAASSAAGERERAEAAEQLLAELRAGARAAEAERAGFADEAAAAFDQCFSAYTAGQQALDAWRARSLESAQP